MNAGTLAILTEESSPCNTNRKATHKAMEDTEFTTDYDQILDRINLVDPIKYAAKRNFINGGVSYLSPYISRGVISLRQIHREVMKKGYRIEESEKFFQELAWREYYQRLWQVRKDLIW